MPAEFHTYADIDSSFSSAILPIIEEFLPTTKLHPYIAYKASFK